MTRSLFVVEDVEGPAVHDCARDVGSLNGSWVPGARIAEYVPRVRCDGCKHWCPHECPQCPVGHGFCEDGEQRAPDWYCAEHEAKEGT